MRNLKISMIVSTVLLMAFTNLKAQYIEMSLEELINNSTSVVEAHIINEFTFEKDGYIYQAHELLICEEVWNNNPLTSESSYKKFIVTRGGVLDGTFDYWSHMLILNEGDEGLFFLKTSEIRPGNSPQTELYYDCTGERQGFYSYTQTDGLDFIGYSLYRSYESADALIGEINQITGQNNVSNSCLMETKSGLWMEVQDLSYQGDYISVNTIVKGTWSKAYSLNIIKLNIEFQEPTNFNQTDIIIELNNPFLAENYDIEWYPNSNHSIVIELTHKGGLYDLFVIESEFLDFILISLHTKFATNPINKIEFEELSYLDNDGNSLNFNSGNVSLDNDVKQIVEGPKILSFNKEVCAGIKQDVSLGNPAYNGFVIIQGEDFGNIDPADFDTEIPQNYRVEFRKLDGALVSGWISPLPEDYVYWTDTEIKVYVPMAGYLNNDFSKVAGSLDGAIAASGDIKVTTPSGTDRSDDLPYNLKVLFGQFNYVLSPATAHSIPIRMQDKENGGYEFEYGSGMGSGQFNSTAFRNDIKAAFCDWNMLEQLKLSLTPTVTQPSGVIRAASLGSSGNGATALARGTTNNNPFSCQGEALVNILELRFDPAVTFVPSSIANQFQDKVVRTICYHEFGHLLQLSHVRQDVLMNGRYDTDLSGNIDIDAIAGGTHVANKSTTIPCPNPPILGVLNECTTNTKKIDNVVEQINYKVQGDILFLDILENDKYIVTITSVDGRAKITSKNNPFVDVSALSTGIYFLSVTFRGVQFNEKFYLP